jgi:conjugative relaxase-like TrwC/TraI family protein
MVIVGGDERLIKAHQKAVGDALEELENHAATRVRASGANTDRTTGNLAIAVYHHDTSRELDPQLHTHAVAANLTYDGAEGRWKALQASAIYERRAYLTEVYRNSLAREVRALGYEIDNPRDARGRDRGFEIRGVSAALLDKFSQRSRQRDAAIDQFTRVNGRTPTDNEVAVLVRESRTDKLTEISTKEVRARQLGRLTLEESHELSALERECPSWPIAFDPADTWLDMHRNMSLNEFRSRAITRS